MVLEHREGVVRLRDPVRNVTRLRLFGRAGRRFHSRRLGGDIRSWRRVVDVVIPNCPGHG
jgi:hypothetical protein